MKQTYDLDLFYEMMISYIDDLETETDFPSVFYQGLYDGVNTLKSSTVKETKAFDNYWVSVIESYYPSIDKIIKNFKTQLKVSEEVKVIEKVKKINSRSIKHLSANSYMLKENDDNGNINPKQLLVETKDIDVGIYENRFIMSLINKLEKYLFDRINILTKEVDSKKVHTVDSSIELQLDKSIYKININLEETELISSGKIEDENYLILKRAQELFKRINGLKNTPFMKQLKDQKEVHSPIVKTQIILKNIEYRNAYLLWQYLDQNTVLNFESISDTKQKRFNESYRKHLSQNSLLAFATMIYHDRANLSNEKLDYKKIKAKKAEALKINPEDLFINPKVYEIEETKINEYYLNKNRQILKKTMDHYLETEPKFEIALKKALKDSIEITNALYESMFEINTDDDLFQKLVKDVNPRLDLNEAQNKFKIASMIRAIKESDLKRSFKLEKKWYNQVLEQQKKFIKWANLENEDFLKEEAKLIENENKIFIEMEHQKVLDEVKNKINLEEEKLEQLKSKLTEKYKKEVEKIELKRKEKLQKLKEKERTLKQKELEKIKAKKKELLSKNKKLISSKEKALKDENTKKIKSLKEKA